MASIISRQFDDAASLLAPSARDELASLEGSHRAGSHTTAKLTARCITTLQELEALRADWLALEAACNDSSLVFQSHDWCHAWASAFLGEPGSPQLCIVTVRQSGKLVALLPAMICVESGPRILRVLSEPFAQYGGILCHPAWRTDAVLDAIFAAIKSHGAVDVIYLRHVREDSVAARFAARYLAPSGYRETAPYMDLSAFDGDEAYQARYTKVQRRRRKKIAAAISKLGEISFHSHKSGSDYDELLRSVVGNKQVWIAERGLISVPLAHPKLVDFLLALGASPAGAALQPVVTTLKAGERCISHELGFRYRGRHCAFITGHDPELTDLSPARLHMDQAQRLALADGMDTFDLMVPGDAYKASWSSGEVKVADHAAPLTSRGWLHCTVYIRFLRPLARLAYRHTPAWLRQAVMPLVQALCAK